VGGAGTEADVDEPDRHFCILIHLPGSSPPLLRSRRRGSAGSWDPQHHPNTSEEMHAVANASKLRRWACLQSKALCREQPSRQLVPRSFRLGGSLELEEVRVGGGVSVD